MSEWVLPEWVSLVTVALLPIAALVAMVIGGVRRGRLSAPLLALGLIAPCGVIAWEAWDLLASGSNRTVQVLSCGAIVTVVILILGRIATRKGWRSGPGLTILGLAVPLLVVVPMLLLLVGGGGLAE